MYFFMAKRILEEACKSPLSRFLVCNTPVPQLLLTPWKIDINSMEKEKGRMNLKEKLRIHGKQKDGVSRFVLMKQEVHWNTKSNSKRWLIDVDCMFA